MVSPGTEAVLLGIVHGSAEFLPLSSAGHLALAQILFRVHGGPGYELCLRAATLLATLLVIAPEFGRALRDGARSLLRPSRYAGTTGGRDALVVLLATVPSALIGFGLSAPVERWAASPLAVGLGFLGTTAALTLAHFAGPGDRDHPTAFGALLIGTAQGLSVLPGLSRVGATIAVTLLLGVRPPRAFELSLLVSLPMLLGGVALDVRHVLPGPAPGATAFVAGVVALGAGLGAARLLRLVVARGRLAWFAFWVGPLALATMAMGLAWPA
jgi:undecaprenyl-diphosphatase